MPMPPQQSGYHDDTNNLGIMTHILFAAIQTNIQSHGFASHALPFLPAIPFLSPLSDADVL